VLAFETRLAKVSKSNEQLSRDTELYYHPVKMAEADKLSPNFPWTKFFESQKVATPEWFSLGIPAFHQEVSKMLADVPVAQWQSWLRFKLLDDASPYLSDAFVSERFDFYGKTLQGQKEQRARWKRVWASSRIPPARPWASAMWRWRFRPLRRRRCRAREQPARCIEGAHREPDLDERRHQEEGAG
jgi:Predicted metalloendopeptidase